MIKKEEWIIIPQKKNNIFDPESWRNKTSRNNFRNSKKQTTFDFFIPVSLKAK